MNFFSWPSRAIALGSILSAFFSSLGAQPVVALEEVVITATRIPVDPLLSPQGVFVISAEEIRAAGVATANEAIRRLGGVVGRIDTMGGRDQTLDLRGFGETASSNVVILVDGVRQNEGDSAGTSLSWIPVDSIERIEIVRGSGAVLYGEGATAGVIHIITNKGLAEPGGSASLSLGTNASRDLRASVRTGSGPWRFQLHGNTFESDNHRQNFVRQEESVLGRVTWADGASQLSLQWGAQTAKGGLPGGINLNDFLVDPRKSYKLQDRGRSEKRNLHFGAETQAGDWRVALDLSHRTDQVESDYVFDGFSTRSATRSSRSSLRTWRNFRHADVIGRLLVGVDAERWHQDRDRGGTLVDQESEALYLRHELDFKPMGLKVYAGARRTQSQREISGNAVGSLRVSNTSWDLGAALRTGPQGEVFGRLGTSFRLANADEFACYPYPGGPACPPVTLLKPQTSQDVEIGYRHRLEQGKWAVRYYSSRITDEIAYDPLGGNTNLDPTLREGFEIDGTWSLSRHTDFAAQLASRRAVFRGGVYAGSTVPLVARQSVTARLTHRFSAARIVTINSQWISAQKIGDDFSNSCRDQIPSSLILNARYSHSIDAWTVSASVNNLSDERYYNLRTRCNPNARSIYPEAGRTLLLSAQRRF